MYVYIHYHIQPFAHLVVLMASSTSASSILGLPEIPITPPSTSPTRISSSQTIIWLHECCSAIQGLLVQAVGILGIQARASYRYYAQIK